MKKLHFVGIGGIGMSALAAMCADMPEMFQVSGSDRGAHQPENARILNPLRKQGIVIYEQDGSFVREGKPDFLIYSTAIEEDNPDFVAGAGIPRLHRSQLIDLLLKECHFDNTIAVTGSCGKSTVCAYCAEALLNLGKNPNCLDGGLVKRFMSETFAGNYRSGDGKFFVFEADESDKSLLNYAADYAIVLNIGTDHYEKSELARVFGEFINRLRRGAVLERGVYEAVKPHLHTEIPIAVVDAEQRPDSRYFVSDYRILKQTEAIYRNGHRSRLASSGDRDTTDEMGANNLMAIYGMNREDCRIEVRRPAAEFNAEYSLLLPQSGFHHAMNALSIFALLEMLGFEGERSVKALERFDGVWRRNDFAGMTSGGVAVFDDYAHNPEKIAGCVRSARELYDGNIYAVFQPHGFKPFGFMRDELYLQLNKLLRRGDRLIVLPPYYAGGTSSFSPGNTEVVNDWKSRTSHPECFLDFPDREVLRDYLLTAPRVGDVILIMGARDNSLSDYARSLTEKARD